MSHIFSFFSHFSYEYLRSQLIILQDKIKNITGKVSLYKKRGKSVPGNQYAP